MSKELAELIANLKEEEALEVTKERLANQENPSVLLDEVKEGVAVVGKRFADGEYFVPDLVYSGEILRQITGLIKEAMDQSDEPAKESLGKVVLGTVEGDIHDIGLNIVNFMLETNGFEVYNVGVDVPAQQFVEKVRETGAEIVALSGLLTLAFDSMKTTVETLRENGLRDKVKIMIGGPQVDEKIREYTDADAFGNDAMTAVTYAKQWSGV